MLPVGSGRGGWPGNGGPPLGQTKGTVGVAAGPTSEWELGDSVWPNFWESVNNLYCVS